MTSIQKVFNIANYINVILNLKKDFWTEGMCFGLK